MILVYILLALTLALALGSIVFPWLLSEVEEDSDISTIVRL